MSYISKKEVASAFKWLFVIIVAAIAYKNVYTTEQFRFINKNGTLLRANTFTGKVEYLHARKWFNTSDDDDFDFISL